MKKIPSLLLPLAIQLFFAACGQKPTAAVQPVGPAKSCEKLVQLSEQQKDQICRFYKVYAKALDKKDAQSINSFISPDYRGSDGLNASQIKSAITKQMGTFPWKKARYGQFEAHGDFSRTTIIHSMDVTLPDGKTQQVKEGISWSKGIGGKFYIINWRHEV